MVESPSISIEDSTAWSAISISVGSEVWHSSWLTIFAKSSCSNLKKSRKNLHQKKSLNYPGDADMCLSHVYDTSQVLLIMRYTIYFWSKNIVEWNIVSYYEIISLLFFLPFLSSCFQMITHFNVVIYCNVVIQLLRWKRGSTVVGSRLAVAVGAVSLFPVKQCNWEIRQITVVMVTVFFIWGIVGLVEK